MAEFVFTHRKLSHHARELIRIANEMTIRIAKEAEEPERVRENLDDIVKKEGELRKKIEEALTDEELHRELDKFGLGKMTKMAVLYKALMDGVSALEDKPLTLAMLFTHLTDKFIVMLAERAHEIRDDEVEKLAAKLSEMSERLSESADRIINEEHQRVENETLKLIEKEAGRPIDEMDQEAVDYYREKLRMEGKLPKIGEDVILLVQKMKELSGILGRASVAIMARKDPGHRSMVHRKLLELVRNVAWGAESPSIALHHMELYRKIAGLSEEEMKEYRKTLENIIRRRFTILKL